MPADTSCATYLVSELAARWRVSQDAVLTWIKNGELVALNVARRRGTRPSWRITAEAVADFETARQVQTRPRVQQRRRREPEVIRYFGSDK